MVNIIDSPTTRKINVEPIRLYQNVLPLLYYNPENIRLSSRLNDELLRYFHYDFYHYNVLDPSGYPDPKGITYYQQWSERGHPNAFSDIRSSSLDDGEDLDAAFDRGREMSYEAMIREQKEKRPNMKEFHYHELVSRDIPKAMIAFFRADKPFLQTELDILKELEPHLMLVVRLMTAASLRTTEYQHFKSYMQITSKISNKYHLSDMEYTIASDILLGHTNEQIAERNFISVSTVKTHVQHIFKKTDAKNRVDFISKFFTSPERVELT